MPRQEYEYDFTLKKFATAIGLFAAVFLVTTVLYGSIKGFGSQKSAVAGGANALNAAFTAPPAVQPCPALPQPAPLSTVAAG